MNGDESMSFTQNNARSIFEEFVNAIDADWRIYDPYDTAVDYA